MVTATAVEKEVIDEIKMRAVHTKWIQYRDRESLVGHFRSVRRGIVGD
jgi:hypothetical protein